ncbi:UNC93-like protein MFSD11 [Macrosteles quadrilineatus]|uniref:UNC93-like protein MFSD11 n=1 Tax=Macrosteles quadrilineatus TaxID=74068 RepID=UPI0023E1B2A3|nr:UNC93-like protein MFSD11 [Macrosteles quadrilineatus]
MWLKMDKELVCILGLSLSFFFLFAADFTMVNMQKTVTSSIASEKADFRIDGYVMIGITYTVFAATLWFGSYVTHALGPKITMAIAAVLYLIYIASYLSECSWVIYIASVSVGLGAGILWPAEGQYMIGNSSSKNTARNVGIFWLIYSSSSMMGNTFVYFTFHDKKHIDQVTRRTAISILTVINIIAIVAFCLLPKPLYELKSNDYGPFKTMKQSWKILTSSRMIWLVITFCYTGLQQSFWNGIYSPSIGFTLAFGNSSKELVALSGIFMSIGAVLGGLCQILLSDRLAKYSWARRMVVLFGALAQGVTYLITFLNLPDTAVFGDTEDVSIIKPPSAALALLGSFLINFGDACISTQIYTFIGDHYRDNIAESVALYKFVKSVLVAASFYWCSHVGLHTQVAVTATVAVFGVLAFFVADRDASQPLVQLEVKNVSNMTNVNSSPEAINKKM